MLDDLRSALRQSARKPWIALIAILSVALGTGATASIFGCLDAFYLRPLPVPRSGELVRVFGVTEQQSFGEISYPEYRRIREQSTALASLAVTQRRGVSWRAADDWHDLMIYLVSADFFQVMAIRPALGRFFGPREEAEPVVVLGYATWKRLFGGDPAVIGRSIRLSRGTPRDVTVVGVMPPEFRSMEPSGDRDIWLPPATFAALEGGSWREFEDWGNPYFDAIGRLRPGVSTDRFRAELAAITSRLAAEHPQTNSRRRLAAMTDLGWRMHQAGTTGWALLALVILVVAISCVNVANLLLAHVETRRKEIATRAALGAGRGRLARLFFLQSCLLGAAGTGAGVILALWIVGAVPALIGLPPEFRSELYLRMDLRLFCATVAVSLSTAMLFGLAPAWIGSRADLADALRNAPAVRSRRFPLRTWLAVSQLALSLVLLSATAALGKSFWNARHGNIGLERKNVLAVWNSGGPSDVERRALERLAGLPGVKDVSVAFRAPLSHNGGGIAMPVTLPGHPEFLANRNPVVVKFNTVDYRYFRILGIRLLRGRLFDAGDTKTAPRVAIVSETMARRYWPAGNPVGRYLRAMPKAEDYQVVGVVADAPINEIGEVPEPYIYTSWWQNSFGENTLLVETEGDAAALASPARAALLEISREFRQVPIFTMDELMREAAVMYRASAELVGALAFLGVLLAAVGFYGVVAYGVSQRTREIGIRMAVGARHSDAASLVMRQALVSAALGIAFGLPCSIAACHALRALLFGITPWYAPAFLGGTAIMTAVALAAAAIPALRAARVDPVEALRFE